MEFDHDNLRQMVEEDRLSSLPDELLHKILSCFNMKYAVQTCVLSSRWEFLWKSLPCLNFSSGEFSTLPKFAKFVSNVVSRRNHQIDVSSVKLYFNGAASQVFVRKFASYIFSHNVQQLTIISWPKDHHEFPSCLFSSQSLRHFNFSSRPFSPCVTTTMPWDFPALTTLYLSDITLSDHDDDTVNIFSKCVNLKNLTLEDFYVEAGVGGVFDIITPQLSNLALIHGDCRKPINLIAPQLENLTIIKCPIKYFNDPSRLSSLYYWDSKPPLQLSKGRFYSLDKVFIDLHYYYTTYEEEDARNTINMLQELHSAKYLTLSWDIIECISSFPDLLSQHPSPFSNLICLTVGPSLRTSAKRAKMSTS